MKKYLLPACELAGIILIALCIITSQKCNKAHDLINDAETADTSIVNLPSSIETGDNRSLSDPHLTTGIIAGKRRVMWSDGEQATISHADSPESGLHPSYQNDFANLCRELPHRGINAITVTMRGDDVTAIFPWTSSGTRTPDAAKITLWKSQLSIFINECKSVNLRPIIIAYIGERTNFQSITFAQYQAWIDVMAQVFTTGDDISGFFIFGIEEVGQSMSNNQVAAWWNPLHDYLKLKMPRCATMLHNNPGKKFWQATSPQLRPETIINVQETSIGNMEATANDALNRGFAIHLHEWYGAIKASQSDATNISKLNQQLAVAQRTGCRCSGIFANDYDTQRPDINKLKNVHIAQGNYFYGNNPPPPPDDDTVTGNIIVEYSKQFSLSPSTTLTNGAQLSAGNYWIGVKTGTAPFTFTLRKGTATPTTYNDGSAPFQFRSPWLQSNNSYTLTATNGGISSTINFTVQ